MIDFSTFRRRWWIEHEYLRILKCFSLTSNVKLAQSGGHHQRSQVQSLLEGKCFCWIYFCHLLCKHSLTTLPTLCNDGKTRSIVVKCGSKKSHCLFLLKSATCQIFTQIYFPYYKHLNNLGSILFSENFPDQWRIWGGHKVCSPGPNSFIFMQFSAK